jgi:hemolysin III
MANDSTTGTVGAGNLASLPAKPLLRGVTHEVAAFVFPVMGVVALFVARSAGARLAVGAYTVGVTGMYATSACYHRGHWTEVAKRRMRRLDHSMILVGIASTYTPVAAVALPPMTAVALLSTVWGLAVMGVVVRNLWLTAPRWVTAGVYIAVGWAAVAVLPTMWAHLGVALFVLLLCGGLVYSMGAVVYSRRRPDPLPAVFGYHEVFHALVLVAGLVFYAVVIGVVARA